MQAKQELTQLKERLQKQIVVLQSEMSVVDQAIELLDREDMSIPSTGRNGSRFSSLGLSEAIRKVVTSDWTSPTEVRDELMHGGYPTDDKSKFLGSVFATMKRLRRRDLEAKRIGGKLKYRKLTTSTNSPNTANASKVQNGTGPSSSKKTQIHEWLKHNGPATRAEVQKGTSLPKGTMSYLSIAKDLFENRDGKWHAR